VQEEADPQQFAKLPTLEDMYDAEHTAEGCRSLEELAPELKTWGIAPAGVPSPENSTIDDVIASIRAAVAVAAEFRRHGIAAEGLLAARCGYVALALDAALAEHFGDVLKT